MQNKKVIILLSICIIVLVMGATGTFEWIKLKVINIIYSEDISSFKGFKVIEETLYSDVEIVRLVRESLEKDITELLQGKKIQVLTDKEWMQDEKRPRLKITISLNSTESKDVFMYVITVAVQTRESFEECTKKETLLDHWSSSTMGQGNIAEIKKAVMREVDLFIQTYTKK